MQSLPVDVHHVIAQYCDVSVCFAMLVISKELNSIYSAQSLWNAHAKRLFLENTVLDKWRLKHVVKHPPFDVKQQKATPQSYLQFKLALIRSETLCNLHQMKYNRDFSQLPEIYADLTPFRAHIIQSYKPLVHDVIMFHKNGYVHTGSHNTCEKNRVLETIRILDFIFQTVDSPWIFKSYSRYPSALFYFRFYAKRGVDGVELLLDYLRQRNKQILTAMLQARDINNLTYLEFLKMVCPYVYYIRLVEPMLLRK
jgi:hypothetical protein